MSAQVNAGDVISLVYRYTGDTLSGYCQTTFNYRYAGSIRNFTPGFALEISSTTEVTGQLASMARAVENTNIVKLHSVQVIQPTRGPVYYSGGSAGPFNQEAGTLLTLPLTQRPASESMSANLIKKSSRPGRRGVGHNYLLLQNDDAVERDKVTKTGISSFFNFFTEMIEAATRIITVDGATLHPIVKPAVGPADSDDDVISADFSDYATFYDTRRRDRGA